MSKLNDFSGLNFNLNNIPLNIITDLRGYFQRYIDNQETHSTLSDGAHISSPIIFDSESNIITINDKTLVPDELVNRLKPDYININEFWSILYQEFPFGVYGQYNTDSINEIKYKILKILNNVGVIDLINTEADNNLNQIKLLEIHPHYDTLYELISENYDIEYHCADFVQTLNAENFYELGKNGLPPDTPYGFDIVIMISLLQHLTDEIRNKIFKDVYDRLNIGGKFVFNLFTQTSENIDQIVLSNGEPRRLFGMFTEDNQPLVSFFGQFTLVPKLDDIINFFKELNGDVDIIYHNGNSTIIKVIKN